MFFIKNKKILNSIYRCLCCLSTKNSNWHFYQTLRHRKDQRRRILLVYQTVRKRMCYKWRHITKMGKRVFGLPKILSWNVWIFGKSTKLRKNMQWEYHWRLQGGFRWMSLPWQFCCRKKFDDSKLLLSSEIRL